HKVKPGITGWAQINGWRGETDTVEKMKARVDHDLYYIQNWSLWLDIRIIFLTLFRGFVGKQAY
ncbi:MAG: sugar transferase, partial [Burkholderiales bacterium]